MRDSRLVLANGRAIAYVELGASSGPAVFFFHGAPMSRLHLVPLDDAFAVRGLRVIAPDRPGYGGSSPRPGRSLLDWPADVAALADALGIERFVAVGHSTGGAYALACAAGLSPRVAAAALFGGVTDMAWQGAWPGYLEGRAEIEVMRSGEESLALSRAAERFGDDGQGFFAQRFELPEADRRDLADQARAASLTAAVVEAFRQGVGGYAQDVYLEGRGWPFDPRRIRVPVTVVHGEADTLVPVAHSRHTSELVPSATFRLLPGHGHLTILGELPRIAADLLRGPG